MAPPGSLFVPFLVVTFRESGPPVFETFASFFGHSLGRFLGDSSGPVAASRAQEPAQAVTINLRRSGGMCVKTGESVPFIIGVFPLALYPINYWGIPSTGDTPIINGV